GRDLLTTAGTMSNGSNGHYGAWIRSRRQDRGKSLEEASAATNIDGHYLRALEAGNIALLPEPYMRAFLKTYATWLGLDATEVLRRFEAFLHEESESLEVLHTTIREREGRKPQPVKERGRPEPGPVVRTAPSPSLPLRSFMVPVAIIAFTIVLIVAIKPGRETSNPVESVQTEAIAEPEGGTQVDDRTVPEQESREPERPAQVQQTQMQPAPGQGDLLEFVADALEDTWMQVIADGDTVVTRVITEGRQVSVTFQDTLVVKVGKNRGMRLYFNQEELTDLGPDGMILSFMLTRAGMQQRRLTYPPDQIPDYLNIPPGS
ncbi:helix-turn-helix domain-containing protein, partial [Gemmatimonadota bacterium]